MITCLHPKVIYNKYIGRSVSVPCGHCEACMSLRSNEWANRCQLEQQGHRYCYFGTLTYSDCNYPRFDMRQLYGLGDVEFDKAFEDSEDFLKIYDYNVRVVDYKDVQLFFKHLRNGIFRDYKERIPFSYFVVCEYGSTTFHPHYHMLLYFDDPRLNDTLKKRVFESWFFKNPHPTLSQFLRFNRWERVRSTAASYVAGYCNSLAVVPSILRYDAFRAKHFCSKSVPFGSVGIQPTSMETFVSGHPVNVAMQRPTTNRIVDVSLWRGIESRFFPKCLGFSLLTNTERVCMYELSKRYPEADNFKSFAERFLLEWIFFPPTSDDWRLLFVKTKDTKVVNTFLEGKSVPFDVERLRKAYYVSKRYFSLVSSYGKFYLSRIFEYYSRKEYNSLVAQLSQEQELTARFDGTSFLPYLPFIIDSLFYDNKRHLPLSTRAAYEEQFCLTGKDYSQFAFEHSSLYSSRHYLFHKICSDNTKIKIKKDYVASHPEFRTVYSNIFTKPLFL